MCSCLRNFCQCPTSSIFTAFLLRVDIGAAQLLRSLGLWDLTERDCWVLPTLGGASRVSTELSGDSRLYSVYWPALPDTAARARRGKVQVSAVSQWEAAELRGPSRISLWNRTSSQENFVETIRSQCSLIDIDFETSSEYYLHVPWS